MSYEPTTWVTGDIITAAKLNNIESGVQSVSSSYTPTTWATGDIITATKLNNIEQGITNAGGGGSGAVSTASVTFNMVNYDVDIMGMFSPTSESYSAFYADDGVTNRVSIEEASKTVMLILDANGMAMVGGDYDEIISLSGDAEFEDPETKLFVVITGDCTINFNGIWNG